MRSAAMAAFASSTTMGAGTHVRHVSDKGSAQALARVIGYCLLEDCASRVWSVLDMKCYVDQLVTIVSGADAVRQVTPVHPRLRLLLQPPALATTCSCNHLILQPPALAITCCCNHLLLQPPPLATTCSCNHLLLQPPAVATFPLPNIILRRLPNILQRSSVLSQRTTLALPPYSSPAPQEVMTKKPTDCLPRRRRGA